MRWFAGHMVKNFLIRISSNQCPISDDKTKLVKSLNQLNIFTAILQSFYHQSDLIIIDISCNHSIEMLRNVRKFCSKKSQFYNWTTSQLSLSDLNRVKIIATNVESPTGAETKFLDLIDELPLLPSSEFFYLIDDNGDVMVKQGVTTDSSIFR